MSTLLLWTEVQIKFQMFLYTSHPYLWCFEIGVNTHHLLCFKHHLSSPICAALLRSAEMSAVHFPIISAILSTRQITGYSRQQSINLKTPLNWEIDILTVYRQGNK